MTLHGRFISLEGGEGTGKSTQVQKIAAYLRARGTGAYVTREPGGTPSAEQIRDLLVRGAPDRWDPMTEALLMNAARREHLMHVIMPRLTAGDWVICDRFTDSTYVYQGLALGVDLGFLDTLQQAVCGAVQPDITFILDLDPTLGLARTAARRNDGDENRFEQRGLEFHTRVREGFLERAQDQHQRCIIVDAACAPEAVFDQIKSCLEARYYS